MKALIPLLLLASCHALPDYVEVSGGQSDGGLNFGRDSDRVDSETDFAMLTLGWSIGERIRHAETKRLMKQQIAAMDRMQLAHITGNIQRPADLSEADGISGDLINVFGDYTTAPVTVEEGFSRLLGALSIAVIVSVLGCVYYALRKRRNGKANG